MNKYQLVIGLETHVELQTKSKIFCSCPTSFGAEPNTHCCPVCTGEPGSLPILNREVLAYAIRAGLATNCRISSITHLDRKNYVYPDLPKAYQISQFDEPICIGGYVELDSGKRIRINHIHVEEDAGKLVHEDGYTYIDYNRGGVPLIEIVSEPDITDISEAREYMEKLQMIMRHIGVSDCKMQEGSMRCDVNISIHEPGTPYGTRTEIKNMNSLTFMEKALAYEYARQCDVVESGEKVVQETRRYNEATQSTESMRSKEDAQDYRYFPEPDILTVNVSDAFVEAIRSAMPELPDALKKRYVASYGLSATEAELIVKYKKIADFFNECASIASPKLAANLILGQIFRSMQTEEEKELFALKITPAQLAALIKLQDEGKINAGIAKSTLSKMLAEGKDATTYLTEADLAVIDNSAVDKLCEEAITNNPRAVTDYKNGKTQAIKALVGYVMKATRGKANSAETEAKLIELICR